MIPTKTTYYMLPTWFRAFYKILSDGVVAVGCLESASLNKMEVALPDKFYPYLPKYMRGTN